MPGCLGAGTGLFHFHACSGAFTSNASELGERDILKYGFQKAPFVRE